MIEPNFTPFPILTTDRLVLRQLEVSDDKDIFIHRSDDKVNTYLENWKHSSIEETQAFIARVQKEVASNKTILWVISEKGKHKFLGTVCFWNISISDDKAETGYTLDSKFQKMGYMNEALAKIIDFGFNKMKLKTIEAYTHKDNERSIRLLTKNKFKLDTTRKAAAGKGDNRIIFILSNENL
jgi:ribosomal-protein-alanine N-acetyltransferase